MKLKSKHEPKPMSAAQFMACRLRLRSARFPDRPMSRKELAERLDCDAHTIMTYEIDGRTWSRPVPTLKADALLRLLSDAGLAVPRVPKPKPATGPQAPEMTP